MIRIPLLLLVTLLVGACASGPPKPTVDYKPDYDFIRKLLFRCL